MFIAFFAPFYCSILLIMFSSVLMMVSWLRFCTYPILSRLLGLDTTRCRTGIFLTGIHRVHWTKKPLDGIYTFIILPDIQYSISCHRMATTNDTISLHCVKCRGNRVSSVQICHLFRHFLDCVPTGGLG